MEDSTRRCKQCGCPYLAHVSGHHGDSGCRGKGNQCSCSGFVELESPSAFCENCGSRQCASPVFTSDWASEHYANWEAVLSPFRNVPYARGLEIGSWEGRSAIWFLDNILTHPTARLACIDPGFKPNFDQNMEPYAGRFWKLETTSTKALRDPVWGFGTYYFAYIDGSHKAANVLEDAILVWPLLRSGGVLIFDDYRWVSPDTPEVIQSRPKIAIDAFREVYVDTLVPLHEGWQVAVQKK